MTVAMKYKVKIPAVDHACAKELGGAIPSDESIHALLEMLEKHNIPFELIASIEVTSTKGSTVVRKQTEPPKETTDSP